jgi:uncharacterized protein YcbK (DUF882 family)
MARLEAASVADFAPGAWRWPHVDPAREWACKGTGRVVVETDFLDRFERLRAAFGRPLHITSGYRSPEYNARVALTGADGPHTTARAVDIRVFGAAALELVVLARDLGFTGFGLAQKGPVASRYVHLDDLPDAPGQPRAWVWTY